MEFRDLQALATLGDLLHFGRAADRLHITQSALSKRIQSLESEIGGALFERNPAQTRLTALGRDLHTEAHLVIDGLSRFVHRSKQAVLGMQGTLKIGFGVSSKAIVLRAISRFRESHRNVQIELIEMSARLQIEAMENGTLDVGFCRTPAPDGWPTIPAVQASLVALVPYGYPEHWGLAELVSMPLATITRSRAAAFYDHVMSYLTKQGLQVQTLQTVFEFSTAITLAEADVAWAIVPSSTSLEQVRARIKPFDDDAARWQIGLVRPPGDCGMLVQAFWQEVSAICAEN